MTKNRGLVVRNSSNSYIVEDHVTHSEVVCSIKGRFRLDNIRTTNPIAIGDEVEYDTDTSTGSSIIHTIVPRRNYIIRRSTNLSKESHIIAANIDHVFLVVTLYHPTTSCEFIDRFLVTCEMYRVSVTIILNKADLYTQPEIDEFIENYRLAGYKVVVSSALSGKGIEEIRELMDGKKSLFSGNSGVGKSTVIGALATNLEIKTGDISSSHHKGKHTTTFSQMFKLSDSTYLIDTPGVKGFGIVDIENDELARYFPDLFTHISDCQFYNCTHTHEPRCHVKMMVEEGVISANRYNSYLKILEDAKNKYR